MKTTILAAAFLLIALQPFAQESGGVVSVNNPILAGFYPDPSICRVGDDYWLVNSSFGYYPGLPLFHSTDLIHWEPAGAAMNRPEQLDLQHAGVSEGLFAPAIRYSNGLFYITCTQVDMGGNFVITAKDPRGPWSNPTWLPQVHGIDPSLFFDDNGKAYIVFNSDPPGNKPLYGGHRTIRQYAFDPATLTTTGEEKILVNGGTDITKEPVWIEGPHIYKKDGYYYLLCAEGGTGHNHSEVVFRSRQVDGPYESYTGNPILTQRQLDSHRPHPVTSTGHADLVETGKGDWYAVFLGCRPYQNEDYNTGRETFMAPVQWKDGWPIINPGRETVPYSLAMPGHGDGKVPSMLSGNYHFRDAFTGPRLNDRYSFLRTVTKPWYSFDGPQGGLDMQLQPASCHSRGNPSFIGFRQAHLKGSVTTSLSFAASAGNEQAGLLVFQNDNHYYSFCVSSQNGRPVLQLFKGPGNGHAAEPPALLASTEISGKNIDLKIKADGNTYSFYYTDAAGKWAPLKEGVDAGFLSSAQGGGFVGCMYALYASSNGKPSANTARFRWFDYQGADEVYE